jgi:hypothetical protein
MVFTFLECKGLTKVYICIYLVETLKESENIDTNWDKFLAILKELENKYIPTRTRKQMGRSKNNIPVDKNTREK